MIFDNDAKLWGSISGFVIMALGWLHIRNNRNEDLVQKLDERLNKFDEKLSEHYMKRPEIITDIKDARAELRRDIDIRLEPIKAQIEKCNQGIDFLIKFHLDEKNRN